MVPVSGPSITVLSTLLWAHSVVASPWERSISTSRQFLVYGSDVRLRGVVCDLAERTKRDLLQLIDQRDEWIIPVVISLQSPQANLPELPRAGLNFAQTGFGLKLQLNLQIDLNANRSEVRRELLRAILLEMMYRRKTDLPVGTTYIPPPSWLLDGTREQESDFETTKLTDVFGVPPAMSRLLSLREFLRLQGRSDLDAPSRLLCGAYSFALVELLTNTSEGRRRLARFIASLPSASNDPLADLASHFLELGNMTSAEKTWRSHIERLVLRQPLQFLSVEETEQKLDELLLLTISRAGAKRRFHLEEFPQFIRNTSARSGLARLSRDLSVLASRAHPICRSTINSYARIAALLARGKTNGITDRLTRLKVSRAGIAARARKINDYMNWFEATKSCVPSGSFTDYLKAVELRSRPSQRRRDRISVYLDALETQFEN